MKDPTQQPHDWKHEEYRIRVVVTFKPSTELPYEDGVEEYFKNDQSEYWQALTEEYPGITLKRIYTAVTPDRIRALIEEAKERNASYQPHERHLLTSFFVELPPGKNPENLAKALAAWEIVKTAHFDPPGREPQVNSPGNPLSVLQGYLDAAPKGIDARYAWGLPGGDGKGQHLIDVERGWYLNHMDLPTRHSPLKDALILGSILPGYPSVHGTSVLGIICGEDNTTGILGIAHHSNVRVASYYDNNYSSNIPNAVLAAIDKLSPGGVLLLEVQLLYVPGSTLYWPYMPVEVTQTTFDVIELAIAQDITVIEAAGNGGHDLDTYEDLSGIKLLQQGADGYRDSGAILVGAASSENRFRLPISNYGSRIDCYAWGENVVTSASVAPGGEYIDFFGGTSAAAAIIAGAALVVQGIAVQHSGKYLKPAKLRDMLSDPATGTPFTEHPSLPNQHIGVMPDLNKIIITHFP
ncbi:MAG TPA: S8 family serine peptidase [Rhodothermales bacterium]|nr:S8 family serine peptidase [Rhodothermales bacterium]